VGGSRAHRYFRRGLGKHTGVRPGPQHAHSEGLRAQVPAGGQGRGTRKFLHSAAVAGDKALSSELNILKSEISGGGLAFVVRKTSSGGMPIPDTRYPIPNQ